MSSERVRANLVELVKEGEGVVGAIRGDPGFEWADEIKSRAWATNLAAMMRSAFGETSVHYTVASSVPQPSKASNARDLLGVARAALKAWDSEYVFELRSLAEANVEASLIDQAEELLTKGYHVAAAVLAGAVLEQHLRSLCPKYGVIPTAATGKPKTMDPLAAELRAAGAFDALQGKHITLLAGIRNDAAHGNPVSADNAAIIVRDVVLLCDKLR
jgi:hypothetical protein